MPGIEPPVGVDNEKDWQRLSAAIPGAAVATTTTLLAALWPDDHLIFDWRVHAAANGLRIAADLDATPGITPESHAPTVETFATYSTIRRWATETATATDQDLRSVERALYELSRKVKTAKDRTWKDYRHALAAVMGGGT